MSLDCVLLAGGRGSRFGGSKQFHPVGPHGETLFEYAVYDAIASGFDHMVIVVQHGNMTAAAHDIFRQIEKHADIDFAYQDDYAIGQGAQRDKPWGTAHAIMCAMEKTRGSFAVANADDFYGRDSFDLIATFLKSTSGAHGMVGFLAENTLSEYGDVSRGVCEIDAQGNLVQVEEHLMHLQGDRIDATRRSDGHGASLPRDTIVSMNLWGFRPSIGEVLRSAWNAFYGPHENSPTAELYIPQVVNEGIAAKAASCKVFITSDSWFGMTYRDDVDAVSHHLRLLHEKGVYPSSLFG